MKNHRQHERLTKWADGCIVEKLPFLDNSSVLYAIPIRYSASSCAEKAAAFTANEIINKLVKNR